MLGKHPLKICFTFVVDNRILSYCRFVFVFVCESFDLSTTNILSNYFVIDRMIYIISLHGFLFNNRATSKRL